MSHQELGYLRDELNQRLQLHLEYGDKTVNIILIAWGGAMTILGIMRETAFKLICPENAILYFIVATVFFTSNIILRSLAHKFYDRSDHISRLGAYIQVFYERQPCRTVKVCENNCWESVNFGILTQDIKNKIKRRGCVDKRNDEYRILILVSFVFILILSIGSFVVAWNNSGILFIFPLLCVIYVIYSIYLYRDVQKYTSLKDNYAIKVKHLKKFFDYSIETGHYTEDEIKDRFGDIYEICKRKRYQ
jgi:hypothetical protein